MRTLFHAPVDALNALFYASSIGVAAGAVGAILANKLEDGLQAGFAAFAIAAACFGRNIWRDYRPRRGQPLFRTGSSPN